MSPAGGPRLRSLWPSNGVKLALVLRIFRSLEATTGAEDVIPVDGDVPELPLLLLSLPDSCQAATPTTTAAMALAMATMGRLTGLGSPVVTAPTEGRALTCWG